MAPPKRQQQAKTPGELRIIAGAWRRRRIEVPDQPDLRPTPNRVRETLFNWLGQDLGGLCCLDLFAGSGALGFEAASRGAARVVMVERDRAALSTLRENRDRLAADAVEIVAAEAHDYLAQQNERFDVVFLDPPFRQNPFENLLQNLTRRLLPDARVYLEAARTLVPPPGWTAVRESRAGNVSYHLWIWSADDQSRLSRNL